MCVHVFLQLYNQRYSFSGEQNDKVLYMKKRMLTYTDKHNSISIECQQRDR